MQLKKFEGQDYNIKTPKEKVKEEIVPYITYPLTDLCNQKCLFCGTGGELTAKNQDRFFDLNTLIDRTLIAISMGVNKFRLTGGEPFLHPQIANILKFFSDQKVYLLVNTNGQLIKKHEDDFVELDDNVHIAVSLHTTKEDVYNKITGNKGNFKKVMEGINFLSEIGNLLRLNMVITKYNKDDIGNMIQLCKKLGCGLKIHEIVDVPKPFGDRESILVPIAPIEKQLAKKAEKIISHSYSESFGIPCNRYIVNGVTINVKSLRHGTRFDLKGLCKNCPYIPCHEGLYDCYVLPSGNVLPCRWGEEFNSEVPFRKQLHLAIEMFQRADFHCLGSRKDK